VVTASSKDCLATGGEARPVIRFETDPGRQMQADFATIRRGRVRLSMFIATLGWSRATYVPSVSLLSLEFGGYISAILT